jgi:hypothetical protein
LAFASGAFRFGFFSCGRTGDNALWEFLCSRFAVPLLERLIRDLSIDEKLRELPSLGLAFKGHRSS